MLRVRSGNWAYRFSVHGKEYFGTTGRPGTEENRAQAAEMEARARVLVEQGQEDQLRIRPIPLAKAIEQFFGWLDGEYSAPASARRIRVSFVSLQGFFAGEKPVHAIRAGQIEDYKTWRRACPVCRGQKPALSDCEHCEGTGAGVQPVTLRNDLHALSVFFQYAQKQGWCGTNPVRDVEIPNPKAERYTKISPEAERAYFAMCLQRGEQDLHDLARLMILQGARPTEVRTTELVDVDLELGTWRIPRSKTKTDAGERVLQLVPEARSIFGRRLTLDKAGRWFFPSPRLAGHAITSLSDEHDAVLEALPGITRWVLYDFRHAFATRMIIAGMKLSELQYILGHAAIETTMRYDVHPDQAIAAEAMRRYGQPDQASVTAPERKFSLGAIREALTHLRARLSARVRVMYRRVSGKGAVVEGRG